MRFFTAFSTFVLISVSCLCAQAQPPAADAPASAANESKGLPPRAAATDYQAHGQAGNVTIAAEFKGHAIPTPELLLNTEDYVAVEVGMYGPADARAKLSIEDFSLRINGSKKTLPSQSDVLVFKSVRDPEWEPEIKAEKGSKTSIGTGGKGGQSDPGAPPPSPPKPPLELQRSWSLKVQKASLPEGDRSLPQAGFLFFKYGGKTKSIQSMELIYNGAAGKATLALEP